MNKLIKNYRQDKLTTQQQADFLSTLAKLVRNGFSIEVALISLKLIYPQQEVILNQVLAQLNSGQTLAQALIKTGLSKTIISQITIADVHGNLVRCLEENAATLVLRQKNKQKILNLLAYPCFLLISLITLLIFLKVELAQQLPKVNFSLWTKIAIILFGLFVFVFLLTEVIRLRRLSELQQVMRKMKWPFIGAIYGNYYQYLILSALSTFLKSGLSLKEIIIAAQKLTPGSVQYDLAQVIQRQLLAGYSLGDIVRANKLLSPEVEVAVNLGHEPLQLAIELQTIAELKHQQVQQKIQRLINQIQPIFFIIVAVMILGTYLSILLPIYSMMKGL
ncbi:type II secretion system F family protein [Bombilactobacillus folatiphilus]|uniref:Type II secretion system F family protein n=1 Tax=Bombilactobacillus folatiphilus TaxID=2923362 RepID=A0ABY4PAB2_9LACO|nr:type II secretion system F family protein [Bombilactobacillus folatiphilus]UQS82494.1 type II secretion system F family protein [Bombilactobacillus folatiphilus]